MARSKLELRGCKTGVIKAVHDADLVQFLKSIDELSRVEEGKAKCKFCGATITLDNIYLIFAENRKVKYCCTDKKCFNEWLKYNNR